LRQSESVISLIFHLLAYLAKLEREIFFYHRYQKAPPNCSSYQLLAPEWQSVEKFAQGYSPGHALTNMLTSRS
jgi:hypothetical protein